MPALADPPKQRKPGKRTPGTWTPEQQRAILPKAAEGRRKWAERRRLAKERAAQGSDQTAPDPIADVEKRLSAAARTQASPTTLNRLADTLVKLKRAKAVPVKADQTCVSYTPTYSSVPSSTHAQTPQAVQPVQYQPSTVQPDFAQYQDHSIGTDKESPLTRPLGSVCPLPPAPGTPTRAVIARITRRLETMGLEELVKLEGQINPVKPEPVVSSVKVGMEPVKSVVGAVPESGVERFCVNGVWISGKRVR